MGYQEALTARAENNGKSSNGNDVHSPNAPTGHHYVKVLSVILEAAITITANHSMDVTSCRPPRCRLQIAATVLNWSSIYWPSVAGASHNSTHIFAPGTLAVRKLESLWLNRVLAPGEKHDHGGVQPAPQL